MKAFLSLFSALAALCVSAQDMVTVTNYVLAANGRPMNGTVTFTPLSTPYFNGTTGIMSGAFSTPIYRGAWSQKLYGGVYQVDEGLGTNYYIGVPLDTNYTDSVYNLQTNIGGFSFTTDWFFTSLLGYTNTWRAPQLSSSATTNNPGPFEFITASWLQYALGTNVLAAKNVNGDMLTDDVVDDVTLEYTTNSPRGIQVKDGGITTAKLAEGVLDYTNFVGNLPSGGVFSTNLATGSVTSNNVAAATIRPEALWGRSVTGESNLVAGELLNADHTLGVIPRKARFVIRCKVADCGYDVGTELDANCLLADMGSPPSYWAPAFTCSMSTTNVTMRMHASQTASYIVSDAASGVWTNVAMSSWRAVVYIEP